MTLMLVAASCSPRSEAQREQRPSRAAATQAVHPTTVEDQFAAPGTVRAKVQTTVSSKLVGTVASVLVREGDRVHRGDLIIEIEGPDVEAQLHRAEAGVAEARRATEEAQTGIETAEADLRTAKANRDLALATRTRYDALRARRSVSLQEFDEVDARYKAADSNAQRMRAMLSGAEARGSLASARLQEAEAELDAARAVAGYLKLKSPLDGLVISRFVEPGMLAGPGTPLLSIDDDSSYQLHAVVDESRIGGIRSGQRATVAIDALQTSLHAAIAEIALPPADQQQARAYTVKLDLELTPALRCALRSGFFGRAVFSAGEREALIVPESALVHRGQWTGVYVVSQGAGLFRLVKTGKSYKQGVEILSGLGEGDQIITAPGTDDLEGVRIVESTGETP